MCSSQNFDTLGVIRKTIETQTQQTLSVNSPVVTIAHTAKGHAQKKDRSPVVVNCYQKLKYVKHVSCVTQLTFAKPVTNVPTVALVLPQILGNLGSFGYWSKSSKILKEGYTLLFWTWPGLTRSTTIISCYVNPVGGITVAYEQTCSRTVKK